jgi:HPt (histidine-containing phosphotransfer) domain-containing protein/PAS domain-containing protein
LAALQTILSKALDYATDHPGLSHEDIKKIRMTNVACGVQSVNLITLTFILLAFNIHSFFPWLFLELLGLIACLHLERKGRFTLAKTVFYTPILIAVAVACAGFDERLPVIVYGFPLTIAPFLLYGRKETRVMYPLVLTSVVLLVAGNLAAGFLDPVFPMFSLSVLPVLTAIIFSMALILTVMIVRGFFEESYRAEQKYIEAANTISEQKERLQTVFDIVEEIILVVGESGRIQEGFSKFTRSVIQRPEQDIIGQNAFDLLISSAHHDRDEVDQCRSALEMSLGAPEIQWFVNQDKILRELEFTFAGQRKVLVLNWQPIIRNGIITNLLLMARDITLSRLHDRIKSEQQERTQALIGIVAAIMKSSRQAVEGFFIKSQQKLQALDPHNTQSVFFELHTLKGVARSLGLQEIANRIHILESSIRSMKAAELDSKLAALAEYIESNLQMVRDIAGSQTSSYPIAFQNLYDVASHTRLNLYSLLEKHQIPLDYFRVDDGVLGWNSAALEVIFEALQHAITNTIDHGFVFPRLRQQITAPKVQLELKAWHEDLYTVIELSDNGNGIDDKSLLALAKRYDLDLAKFENPLDLLFESGVSSTTEVSLTSGRGVGTAAVRDAALRLKGKAMLRRNPERGLTLRLILPRETSLYSTHTIQIRGQKNSDAI